MLKRVFPAQNRKVEHYHRIYRIEINQEAKFQLNQTLLIFLAKLSQKR